MSPRRREWVFAIGIWLFSSLWIIGLTAGFFSAACAKPKLSAEQRLFRCGWSLTLSEPLRLIGEPDHRYAERYMRMGIAHAELGQNEPAANAFRNALIDAGLTIPISPDVGWFTSSSSATALMEMASGLPPNSAARSLFFEVAEGVSR